jgi:hypothetical protein
VLTAYSAIGLADRSARYGSAATDSWRADDKSTVVGGGGTDSVGTVTVMHVTVVVVGHTVVVVTFRPSSWAANAVLSTVGLGPGRTGGTTVVRPGTATVTVGEDGMTMGAAVVGEDGRDGRVGGGATWVVVVVSAGGAAPPGVGEPVLGSVLGIGVGTGAGRGVPIGSMLVVVVEVDVVVEVEVEVEVDVDVDVDVDVEVDVEDVVVPHPEARSPEPSWIVGTRPEASARTATTMAATRMRGHLLPIA